MRRPSITWMLVAALVALSGCASTAQRRAAYPAQPDYTAPQAKPASHYTAAPTESLATDIAESTDAGLRKVEPGTGEFINKAAARQAAPVEGKAGDVTFNFEGDSLNAVVKAILGDYLQQNYVIAPGVQGTVTFSTAKPMRRDQVMSILEMLLRWNNATLVWEDGRYTILPVDQALPGNLIPGVGKPHRMGFQVRAVPLEYISATEMEKLLKPYARPNAVVSTDNARSMIVLAGTPAELNNYLQTIDIFDVDWLAGMSVGVFPMQQIEAAKVVGELEKVFGASSDTPLAGMFRFLPLDGINAVLVITPQPEYLRSAEQWLQRLDQGGGGGGLRLYVYEVKNVKATDLADTLSEVFGSGGGSSSRRSSGDNAVGPGLQATTVRSSRFGASGNNNRGGIGGGNQRYAKDASDSEAKSGGMRVKSVAEMAGKSAQADAPQQQNVVAMTPPPAPPRPNNVAAQGNATGSGNIGIQIGEAEEVRISAVEESNSLLVRATPAQWDSILSVIERLDQIPLQVHIEAKIIQVDLNKSLTYGVQWFFENGVPEDLYPSANTRTGWGDHSGLAGALDSNGSMSPLGWTFIGPDMAAIVSALDSVSKVEVLSAPSVLVLNNKSAMLNVGSQIPINSTSINSGNIGGNGVYSSVQYLQTGITLDVTPRVNPGGLVFLEIQQEDSTPGDVPEGGTNPPISQRAISTEVAVQSGGTVLLGGLMKHTKLDGKSGVPFLSRIPILGGLFGRDSTSNNRQELIVLIKPTVVYNQQDARRVTEEYRQQFQGLEPLRVIVDDPVQ